MPAYARKPQKKGVAKVPVIMQMEAMECGAACLAMIMAYYRKWVPLEEIREKCGVSRDGAKLGTVSRLAKSYGMNAQGYYYATEDLWEKATFPCIAHWRGSHFVVIKGRRGKTVYINDPGMGEVAIPYSQYVECFWGTVLCLEPGKDFKPGGRQTSILAYTLKQLSIDKKSVAIILAASVAVTAIGIFVPKMQQYFVDTMINSPDAGTAPWVYIALLAAALVQLAAGWIQALRSYRLHGYTAVKSSSSFFRHLLAMPINFFSQRTSSDLQMRQMSNAEIASIMMQQFVPLALNTLMIAIYAAFMASYSLPLACLGLFGVVLQGVYSNQVYKRRINASRVMRRDEAALASSTAAAVTMIDTIKASGAETGYFEQWARFQESVQLQQVRYDRSTKVLGAVTQILAKLTSALTLYLGIIFAMNGQLSAGMVIAFQSMLTAVMSPVEQLLNSAQGLQEMRADMERIEDVRRYPEYNPYGPLEQDVEYEKLKGRIELRHVDFGYSPLEEPLIRDFNLDVAPGSCVAIVGPSGCGKSTATSLISTLYEPWSGEILFDGKRVGDIPRSVIKGSISVVEQSGMLFPDTIENNIKMWDSTLEDVDVIQAAMDAQIHDDIVGMPGGYSHMLSNDASELSGGQAQRLEVARALASNPSILIMDEATSALDAVTEFELMEAVRARKITYVIVAHRLSTIRDCDEIIVMDEGRIVERGTHDSLMALHGAYEALIRNG